MTFKSHVFHFFSATRFQFSTFWKFGQRAAFLFFSGISLFFSPDFWATGTFFRGKKKRISKKVVKKQNISVIPDIYLIANLPYIIYLIAVFHTCSITDVLTCLIVNCLICIIVSYMPDSYIHIQYNCLTCSIASYLTCIISTRVATLYV